ncbi:hypothetical protein M0804_015153 [Polistes exclamans]|nr:hypothetical protein M0804_015153 [Polistes exclamans]
MPLLRLPAGIYAGEALIKNNNGKGLFRITNTTSKQYMFEIPRLELSDFSEDTLLNSGSDTGNKTTDPDSSEILSFIHTIFTEKNGEECPKLNTLEFETKDNQTDDEDSDIEIERDNKNILDKTAGEVNDLTESLCALTDTGETGGVCSDTGSTCDYNVLYSPQHTRVDTHTQMLTSNMGITRDPFILRKDNLVIFTDIEGTPCKTGAKLLSESKLLPKLKDLTLGRAKVTNICRLYLFAIPVKEHDTNSIRYETLIEALGSLLAVTRELGLTSVSIARTFYFDNERWQQVQTKLGNAFDSESCKIVICTGKVTVPS